MIQIQNSKQKSYDLEERTYKFADDCRELVRIIRVSENSNDKQKQLVQESRELTKIFGAILEKCK